MTAHRQATIRRAAMCAIAVAGFATAAWFMGAVAAHAAQPTGVPPAGAQGALDRVDTPDLITTLLGVPAEIADAVGVQPVVTGVDAVLICVLRPVDPIVRLVVDTVAPTVHSVARPAIAALPVGMPHHHVVRHEHGFGSRAPAASFPMPPVRPDLPTMDGGTLPFALAHTSGGAYAATVTAAASAVEPVGQAMAEAAEQAVRRIETPAPTSSPD